MWVRNGQEYLCPSVLIALCTLKHNGSRRLLTICESIICSPTLMVTGLLQCLLDGGLMDWAKTKASRTAMEDVSSCMTSRDCK